MTGDLTGTFNTFVSPLDDVFIGFTEFTGSFSGDAADLPADTWFLEYDETLDVVNFHYKVSGSVPEPGTVGMLALGILFLRASHDRKRRSRK